MDLVVLSTLLKLLIHTDCDICAEILSTLPCVKESSHCHSYGSDDL